MELDHSSASLAVVPPNAGVLQNETDVCQPQEEWNVAASFADEEPASCISALEFRRAVLSAGRVYCEQIRALRIPPEFPGFAVDQKVGYVADCLQAMSEACRDEFLRLHHRADEQDRSIQEFSTCLQNGDFAMFAENKDLQRINGLEDGVNDELFKLTTYIKCFLQLSRMFCSNYATKGIPYLTRTWATYATSADVSPEFIRRLIGDGFVYFCG